MGGNRRKKRKIKGSKEEPEELVKAPHSFVIKRGDVGKHIDQLMTDFRAVMEPFTASHLKMRKKNVIKDFVSISSYLNVTHLAIFTRTNNSPYFRLARLPRGPTITYKVVEYTLTHDVISSMRKPHVNPSLFHASPLLVLNGFSGASAGEDDVKTKLTTSMWRNMFPSIDIHKVQLSKIRRCVLLNADPETGLIDFRHYAIKVKPVGLTGTVRKLLTGKRVPDLGAFRSVEEAMERDGAGFTESEGEMADEVEDSRHVTLPQRMHTRGNLLNEKSSIRLIELGPRMKLELVKIENGIMGGEVLHHAYITKTREEVKELKTAAEQRAFLKLSRKKQQEENVKRKLEEKDRARAEVEKRRAAVEAEATGEFKRPQPRKTKTDENDQKKKKVVIDTGNEADVEDDGDDADDDNIDDDEYDISDEEMLPLDDADL